MWLGPPYTGRSLALVQAFITGYQQGEKPNSDPLQFGYFTPWVGTHYRVIDGPMDGFSLIREKVGGDEDLAFEEFFRLLPLFIRDLEKMGPEGIVASYRKVLTAIRRRR